MASKIQMEYNLFLGENANSLIKTLYEDFIDRAKRRNGLFGYQVEFTLDDSCLIKFPSHEVSLRIREADWDRFCANFRDRSSKLYKIDLIDNFYRCRVSSTYLNYSIFNPVCVGTIDQIEYEITRVQKLLNNIPSNSNIKLINDMDEPWGDELNPINTSITLDKESYRVSVLESKKLVDEIRSDIDNMIQETKKKTDELYVKNKENYDTAYLNYNIKLVKKMENEPEQPQPPPVQKSSKKLKPVLGEDNHRPQKVIQEGPQPFAPPSKIHQNFFNITIVPSNDYLLLIQMTNPDCDTYQKCYMGFKNTPFNMVHNIEKYGVELVFLDKHFNIDHTLLKNIKHQVVSSSSEFLTVFNTIEKYLHKSLDS